MARLEGASSATLRGALAAFLEDGDVAFQRSLRQAGLGRADARALSLLLGDFGLRPAPGARLLSGPQLERALRRAGAPGVRVSLGGELAGVTGRLALVGPSRWRVGPGRACAECARLRFAEEVLGPPGELGDDLLSSQRAWMALSEATLSAMAEAARAPARQGWLGGELGQPGWQAEEVTHPGCARHGARPASAAPRWGRSAPLRPARAALAASWVLGRLGALGDEVIERARPGATLEGLPSVAVSWRRALRDARGELVIQAAVQVGRGGSLVERLLSARAEAIERVLVGGRAPDVRGRSLAQLGWRALPPEAWGLFAPEQYRQRDFPFAPFDRHAPRDWVEAWDFAEARRRLVPLDLVNGGAGDLVPGSSTGAAAHTSLERVVARGLLEVIEREALQRAWYQGQALARVPDGWARGPAARQLAWGEARGWRVRAGYAPGRAGLHAVALLGERRRAGSGLPAGACVFTSAASGSAWAALEAALQELLSAAEGLGAPGALAPEVTLADAWRQNDPAVIHRLYLQPELRPALDWFFAGPKLAALPPDRPDRAGALLRALVAEGLRPLLVDCTVPEAAPFHAGKVLLLGALPHSFATGQLRVGGLGLAPPRRARRPPRPGWRPTPGQTTPYPFPLG